MCTSCHSDNPVLSSLSCKMHIPRRNFTRCSCESYLPFSRAASTKECGSHASREVMMSRSCTVSLARILYTRLALCSQLADNLLPHCRIPTQKALSQAPGHLSLEGTLPGTEDNEAGALDLPRSRQQGLHCVARTQNTNRWANAGVFRPRYTFDLIW